MSQYETLNQDTTFIQGSKLFAAFDKLNDIALGTIDSRARLEEIFWLAEYLDDAKVYYQEQYEARTLTFDPAECSDAFKLRFYVDEVLKQNHRILINNKRVNNMTALIKDFDISESILEGIREFSDRESLISLVNLLLTEIYDPRGYFDQDGQPIEQPFELFGNDIMQDGIVADYSIMGFRIIEDNGQSLCQYSKRVFTIQHGVKHYVELITPEFEYGLRFFQELQLAIKYTYGNLINLCNDGHSIQGRILNIDELEK